jgi:SAM-dependent methyltransferase
MTSLAIYGHLLRCTKCGTSDWVDHADAIACRGCGLRMHWDDGVLVLGDRHQDDATRHYDAMGGPRFIDVTFESNLHIHCVTRKYKQYLDAWFPAATGALLDLGCGDGRLSLWALERGFPIVVALDTSLDALKRLAKEARARNLEGLVPVCATFQDECIQPHSFDIVLLFEALCYTAASWSLEKGLALLHRLVKPGGRAVVSEISRNGRLLVDTIAINVENMTKTAVEKKRWEKLADSKVESAHTTPDELIAACEHAGFRVVKRGGVSPLPMLFYYTYNLTSFPLRPALDAKMQQLIETLDDQTSELSTFSRNTVLMLEPAP